MEFYTFLYPMCYHPCKLQKTIYAKLLEPSCYVLTVSTVFPVQYPIFMQYFPVPSFAKIKTIHCTTYIWCSIWCCQNVFVYLHCIYQIVCHVYLFRGQHCKLVLVLNVLPSINKVYYYYYYYYYLYVVSSVLVSSLVGNYCMKQVPVHSPFRDISHSDRPSVRYRTIIYETLL